MNELYITSAWTVLTDEQRRQQPQAGDVFRMATEVKGRLPWKFVG